MTYGYRGYGKTWANVVPVGAGSAQVLPPVIPTAAWWDFSDSSTVFQDDARSTPSNPALADPIGGVADKSGQGRHLTQPTANLKPTYRTRGFQKSALYNPAGVGQNLIIPAGLSLDRRNSTLIIVKKTNAIGGSFQSHLNLGTNGLAVMEQNGSFANVVAAWSGSATLSSGIEAGMGVEVMAVVYRPTETKFFHGREVFSIAAADAGVVSGPGFLGRWGTDVFRLNGHHYEILLYNSALSDPQIQAVSDYCSAKWRALSRLSSVNMVFEGDSTRAGVDSSEVDGDVTPSFLARADWSAPAQLFRNYPGAQPKWFNDATGGDLASAMAAATNLIGYLNASPAFPIKIAVFGPAGTNDISNAVASATVMGHHNTAITNLRNGVPGVIAVGSTILPRGAFSQFQSDEVDAVNNHIRNVAAYDRVLNYDAIPEVLLKTNTTWYPDLTHPSRALKALIAEYDRSMFQAWGYLP